jgi:hypothetical protein
MIYCRWKMHVKYPPNVVFECRGNRLVLPNQLEVRGQRQTSNVQLLQAYLCSIGPIALEELYVEGQHDRALMSQGSKFKQQLAIECHSPTQLEHKFWRNKEGGVQVAHRPGTGTAVSHEHPTIGRGNELRSAVVSVCMSSTSGVWCIGV